MSLCPQPLPPVPDEDTARIARAAFRRGTPYMLLRDRLGAVFADADFAHLYPKLGRPLTARGVWRWSRLCSHDDNGNGRSLYARRSGTNSAPPPAIPSSASASRCSAALTSGR